MTNATATYMIMLLVFACGMWMILVFGSTIEAQHDLAGEWEFSPEGRVADEPLVANIEQSGRYVRMRMGGRTYDLRITLSAGRVELQGDGTAVTFVPSPARDVYRVTLESPELERRRYSARITRRTHPRAPAGNKPQSTGLSPAKTDAGPTQTMKPAAHAH